MKSCGELVFPVYVLKNMSQANFTAFSRGWLATSFNWGCVCARVSVDDQDVTWDVWHCNGILSYDFHSTPKCEWSVY